VVVLVVFVVVVVVMVVVVVVVVVFVVVGLMFNQRNKSLKNIGLDDVHGSEVTFHGNHHFSLV